MKQIKYNTNNKYILYPSDNEQFEQKSTNSLDNFTIDNDFIEQKYWMEAETMISSHLIKNLKIGAKFEAYIVLILRHIIEMLGLTDTLKISHNQFTPKTYSRNMGRKADIVISKQITNSYGTMWQPVYTIECKNFINANPYISPKQFTTHILTRFKTALGTTQLLITKGINQTKSLTQQLTNNTITHITTNYLTTLVKYLIQYNNNPNNMSKTRQLYTPQQQSNNTLSFTEHKTVEEGRELCQLMNIKPNG